MYTISQEIVLWNNKKVNKVKSDGFSILHPCIGKDKNAVYFQGKPTKYDPASFLVLNEGFAKDKKVCLRIDKSKLISVAGAHPESFESLSKNFARDKNNIYFEAKPVKIPKKNIPDFKVMDPQNDIAYAYGSYRIYLGKDFINVPSSLNESNIDIKLLKCHCYSDDATHIAVSDWLQTYYIEQDNPYLIECSDFTKLKKTGHLITDGKGLWDKGCPLHGPVKAYNFDDKKELEVVFDPGTLTYAGAGFYGHYYVDHEAVWSFFDKKILESPYARKNPKAYQRQGVDLAKIPNIIKEASRQPFADLNSSFQTAYKLLLQATLTLFGKQQKCSYVIDAKGEVTITANNTIITKGPVSAWYSHASAIATGGAMQFLKPTNKGLALPEFPTLGVKILKDKAETRLAVIKLATSLMEQGEETESKILAHIVFEAVRSLYNCGYDEKSRSLFFPEMQEILANTHPKLLGENCKVKAETEAGTVSSVFNQLIDSGDLTSTYSKLRLNAIRLLSNGVYKTRYPEKTIDLIWPAVKKAIETEPAGYIRERLLFLTFMCHNLYGFEQEDNPAPDAKEQVQKRVDEIEEILLKHKVNIRR